MQRSEKLDKLGAALAKAQGELRDVGKSGENTYDRYKYATLVDYIGAARPVLAANGISIIEGPEKVESLPDRKTQKGNTEYAVRVTVTALILHDSGQWVEASGVGEGQDRADKGVYKAITGARKYIIACLLNLATTDDPEADETVGVDKPTPQPQRAVAPKANGSALRKQVVESIKAWTGFHPEDIGDAVAQIKAKLGITTKETGEADLRRMLEIVNGCRATAVKFEEWIRTEESKT